MLTNLAVINNNGNILLQLQEIVFFAQEIYLLVIFSLTEKTKALLWFLLMTIKIIIYQ